ncbi:MAG: glycine dehydrogenase subunit 2 [bacterium]|nr:glycine dehydrogenase subunit 2 [bacterium]
MPKPIYEQRSKQTEYIKDCSFKPENFINPDFLEKSEKNLPHIGEVDIARHFTELSKEIYGVDDGIYPLGSCTMKYNPKITEKIAASANFTETHPYLDVKDMQASLRVMYETEKMLAEISGMAGVTLSPCAGAHGEYTGLLIINKYHQMKGEGNRKKVIIPDTAHGTNPASCSCAGMQTIQIKTDEFGNIDLVELEKNIDDETAAFMLTNPSTLGFFEENILEIAKIVHSKGALLYYDGANLNPLLGISRPGDMGFDVMHFNLHKTFATPHGGGGPGSGPVGVKEFLKDFLPYPLIEKVDGKYLLKEYPNSVGRVRSFYANFPVILKTYFYILMLGRDGLKKIGETSIWNANYLLDKVKNIFEYPFGDKSCLHEFVVTARNFKNKGIRALDIAKRMIDYGIHPPTIYFPLIVEEAMMFEPTETESKESIGHLVDVLEKIKAEIENNPEIVKSAPQDRKVGRLDELKAIKSKEFIWS